MSMAGKTRKIELTRSVILSGHGHCEVGEQFELAPNTAHDLVGAECARYVDDEPHPNGTGYVTRVENPENADPAPKRVAGKPKAKAE
jgi:hypothetical protein